MPHSYAHADSIAWMHWTHMEQSFPQSRHRFCFSAFPVTTIIRKYLAKTSFYDMLQLFGVTKYDTDLCSEPRSFTICWWCLLHLQDRFRQCTLPPEADMCYSKSAFHNWGRFTLHNLWYVGRALRIYVPARRPITHIGANFHNFATFLC